MNNIKIIIAVLVALTSVACGGTVQKPVTVASAPDVVLPVEYQEMRQGVGNPDADRIIIRHDANWSPRPQRTNDVHRVIRPTVANTASRTSCHWVSEGQSFVTKEQAVAAATRDGVARQECQVSRPSTMSLGNERIKGSVGLAALTIGQ